MTPAALTAYPPQGSERAADASSPLSPLVAVAGMVVAALLVAPPARACTRAGVVALGDCGSPAPEPPPPRAPAPRSSSANASALSLTNGARAEHGRARLGIDPRAQRIARAYARTIAARSRLAHNPRLQRLFPAGIVGEIVGVGPSVARVHEGFLRSAPHRRVMLGRDWRGIGVGVVARGDSVWVVQVFVAPPRSRRVRAAPAAHERSDAVRTIRRPVPPSSVRARHAVSRHSSAPTGNDGTDGAGVPRGLPVAAAGLLAARALLHRRLAR